MTEIKDTGKYQLLPDMGPAEFEALRADIAERGVVVPIDIDEAGEIIDGHHRYRAWLALKKNEPPPTIVREGLSDQDKRAFARKNNILRRHLTREQVRAIVAAQLKDTPQWADNRIAKDIGVDGKTVGDVRTELVSTSEIPKFERLIGADGKERPAKRQQRPSKADQIERDAAEGLKKALGYDRAAVEALPNDVKLAFFNAGIPKDSVIVVEGSPWPEPDLTPEQIRRWDSFGDFLTAECGGNIESVGDHFDWLLRHDFKTPDEWLGEEGEQYRAKWRMRPSCLSDLKNAWEAWAEANPRK
jgi:ParB-like chromosome segregation protein Spo0J